MHSIAKYFSQLLGVGYADLKMINQQKTYLYIPSWLMVIIMTTCTAKSNIGYQIISVIYNMLKGWVKHYIQFYVHQIYNIHKYVIEINMF